MQGLAIYSVKWYIIAYHSAELPDSYHNGEGEVNRMFEQDYIMRMIHDLVRMLAKLLLGKDTVMYEFPDEGEFTEGDFLYKRILQLLEDGRINEAENMLFDEMHTDDLSYFEMAMDFYTRLNQLDDGYLEEHDYSREEIEEGIQMAARSFGISDEVVSMLK